MPSKLSSFAILCLALLGAAPAAQAERLKELASIAGVRENQLSGYGIVVGLDGTGDQTSQTPFTVQSIQAMLQQKGINLPPGTQLQLKNVAAVMVTTSLPAFAQPGQTIDITVSSIGNAKSLRGGTLLMTPLHGADGQVYAMAQGNVLVGGVGAQVAGAQVQVNHLSVGKISAGATVERAVASTLGADNQIRLELKQTDFSTAARVVEAINDQFGAGVATALDGRVVRVRTPSSSDQRVAFIGQLENIDVSRGKDAARVVMNARTGSVVMNQAVMLDDCAISHGNLTVTVGSDTSVSQPAPGSLGATAVTQTPSVEVKKDPGRVLMLKGGASLADVVKAMNAIGTTPQDLLAILQALKSAGALRAELEII
ncbi:flagellar basal body P-ring protein FlgI [Massilia sp. MS-15]|uniref:flagellar basal body P-ring protein FlgI n=1 Tax=Massilia sp. MS-15 TaxID=2878200 RepID=UPI001CD1D13F|nr:flagellar basal body P-ring protein FlgI [Massilia sp. MS-15]MCA1248632.1 flagellar basal body P-ring protein FlgI [Massilia sp. MS-15]